MSNLPLSIQEADLVRKLLVAIRPIVQQIEQYGEQYKPHDGSAFVDIWRAIRRGGIVRADVDPIIGRLKALEFGEEASGE